MRCPSLKELPLPSQDKTAWPWNEDSPHMPDTMTNGSPWPRISIVTPSLNQGQFIEETIRSVLLQGYPNLEYIIIDGGSDDGSVEIIKKYEKWITYWMSERDNGQGNAINKGFRKSSGHILGWLNSDDILKSSALQRIAKKFMIDSSVNIVCGFRNKIDLTTNIKSVKAHIEPDKYTLSRICYINQETVYWKRSVWEDIGEIDETFKYALDYDLWQRMLIAGYRFELIPCVQGAFRIHPKSKGSQMEAIRAEELRRIYRKYLNTDKQEEELRNEIDESWWEGRDILMGLGNRGFLKKPCIGNIIVKLLTYNQKYAFSLIRVVRPLRNYFRK